MCHICIMLQPMKQNYTNLFDAPESYRSYDYLAIRIKPTTFNFHLCLLQYLLEIQELYPY